MRDKVKKIINFRFYNYRDLEIKLEKLAANGLFLEECGAFGWSFIKGEPQNLKYTVTYFSEGSVFNPGITDNQLTYFDYAKVAGWDFVTQFNQMQIFCSSAENPIPFETDEKEKLENIKKCMKKSFYPSMIAMVLIFIFNLVAQFNSFKLNPINFLSNPDQLLPAVTILVLLVYEMYSLLDYFIWCKRSEQSVANGGECLENTDITHKIVDIIFTVFIFGYSGYYFIFLGNKTSWVSLLFFLIQIPIMTMVFWWSIKQLKKKKVSSAINKVISFTVLIILNFACLGFIVFFIIKFGFITNNGDYRTVAWPITETMNHEYKLYNDDIPLTCEDLYGKTNYEYYSYEKEIDSTLFLTKSSYRQDSLPAKNSPPRIKYEILDPHFDFVYLLAKNHLLEIPEWQNDVKFKALDNSIFETVEAYEEYYDDTPTGNYILIFKDKIIVLNMEDSATQKQISIIKEKLQI